MRPLRPLALALLLLAPRGAGAAEAVFGVEALTDFNTNVFGQPEGGDKDGSFRGGPFMLLRDRTGNLNWELGYRPSYQAFYTLSGVNSFYHFADGEISWRPSADWDFYANESFSYTPVRSTSTQTVDGTVLAQPIPDFTNQQVLQNYLTVGVRHAFTPRWFSDVSVSSSILDYESDLYSDSASYGAQGFLTYLLTPRDTIGGGLGYTAQTIQPVVLDPTTTSYYQLFGIWNHDFSPTLRLEANAGPTLVSSPDSLQEQFDGIPQYSLFRLNQAGQVTTFPIDPGSCSIQNGVVSIDTCSVYALPFVPGLLPGQVQPQALTSADLGLDSFVTLPLVGPRPDDGGTELTYFANIKLEKEWKNLVTSIRYLRNASTTSGLNQSIITDTLNFVGVWSPSPVWRATLAAYLTMRESNADQPQYFVVGEVVPGLVPCSIFVSVINQTVGCGTLPGARATGVNATVARSNRTNLTNYLVSAQLNRSITRSSYVYARFTWDRQNTRIEGENLFSSATVLNTSSVNRYIVAVGFVYEFDPIHLSWD